VVAWNVWGAHLRLHLCRSKVSTTLIQRIEHGVTEALHTTDGWVRKEKKPSSLSGPCLAGQWPCASWVTGGSLSPASPLQEQGKYHPDTENTKIVRWRLHHGLNEKLNLQAVTVNLGSGLVLLWWLVEAWNTWGAHPLLPLCNKNGSTALIQRI
jgi:hypothetical protein